MLQPVYPGDGKICVFCLSSVGIFFKTTDNGHSEQLKNNNDTKLLYVLYCQTP